MLTMAEVNRRSRFATSWVNLLYQVASGLHFHAHYAAEAPGPADEQLRAALRAAWRLLEHERDHGPAVGDHFARLVSWLPQDMAAVRHAALAFAAAPGDATRRRLLDAVRKQFPAAPAIFEFYEAPFADDEERRAWAERRLPAGEDDGAAGVAARA